MQNTDNIRQTAVAFPKPGDLFEGRYRIGTMIGAGGFARVYSAMQEDLGRVVALKILTPPKDGIYEAKVVDRFNQEARLVSRLQDPHTITMFDFGRSSNGLLYMVFEYVNGISLSKLISNEAPLAPARVVKILQQTLSSLEEAHALGVLHRDIKPGNIMVFEHVGRSDQTKLLDFGIAKLTGQDQPQQDLTADGALIGTPRYMSPEQIRGEKLTAQSDIYSLGLVAYEMLMGRKAIESNSSVTIIGKQLDPQSFMLPVLTTIPVGLRTIINRMLAKERDGRYLNAAEVMNGLSSWNDSGVSAVFAQVEDATNLLPDLADLIDISDEIMPLDGTRDGLRTVVPRRETPPHLTQPQVFNSPAPQPAAFTPPPIAMPQSLERPSRSSVVPVVAGIAVLCVIIGALALVSYLRDAPVAEPVVAVPLKIEAEVAKVAPPLNRRLVIRTTPTGLNIMVNGRPATSPATFTEEEVGFPVRIRVKSGENLSPEMVVNDFAADIVYDATDYLAFVAKMKTEVAAPVEEAPAAVKTPQPKKSPPRDSKKVVTTTKAVEKKPDDATSKVDSEKVPAKYVPKGNFPSMD